MLSTKHRWSPRPPRRVRDRKIDLHDPTPDEYENAPGPRAQRMRAIAAAVHGYRGDGTW